MGHKNVVVDDDIDATSSKKIEEHSKPEDGSKKQAKKRVKPPLLLPLALTTIIRKRRKSKVRPSPPLGLADDEAKESTADDELRYKKKGEPNSSCSQDPQEKHAHVPLNLLLIIWASGNLTQLTP